MSTLPSAQQAFVDRFRAACQADDRIGAAFLAGSYARGEADAYSDIDLGLITTDKAYDDFMAGREAFMRSLGPVEFLESFSLSNFLFFIFADGIEGELGMGHESDLLHLHSGPYVVLMDKTGLLDGVTFPYPAADPDKQRETLRRLIYDFWHDLSHFITAMGRNQLWWAYGQLNILREMCVNLAQLRYNFAREAEGYDKIEKALPIEWLAGLQPTFCPMERTAMLQAGRSILQFYKDQAIPLAQAHGLAYSAKLEQVMVVRLNGLT